MSTLTALPVTNPYTGERVGDALVSGGAAITAAIDPAPRHERARILFAVADRAGRARGGAVELPVDTTRTSTGGLNMPNTKPTAATKRTAAPRKRTTTAKPRARRRRPTHQQISERAYFIYLDEGNGDEFGNWLRAERELAAA